MVLEQQRKEYNDRMAYEKEQRDLELEKEKLYWKDYYEKRSSDRKDASDLMKFIPGIIVTVGAAIIAWDKLKDNKK